MPFDRPSLQTLQDRLRTGVTSRLENNIPLMPRAVLLVLAYAFAAALHLLYGAIVAVAYNFLETKAQGIWLLYLAARRGLYQRAPAYAQGNIVFTGRETAEIPSGTQVLRGDGAVFTTTEDGVITSGFSSVNAIANDPGASGNTDPGMPMTLSSSVGDIDADVTVDENGITGGADLEDLESLRQRLLYVIRNPGSGGSEADYIKWAMTIPGVFRVDVFGAPDYVDAGFIAVLPVVKGNSPVASDPLIAQVNSYIQTRKPADATVNVFAVTPTNIELDIQITPSDPATIASVTASLADFFLNSVSTRMKISLAQLSAAITAGGAFDHEYTTIKQDGTSMPIQSLQLTGFQYPVLTTLHITDLPED